MKRALVSDSSHSTQDGSSHEVHEVCRHEGLGLAQSAVYSSVAETDGLKPKQVKGVVEGIMGVASEQLKKNGALKLAGVLNRKLSF